MLLRFVCTCKSTWVGEKPLVVWTSSNFSCSYFCDIQTLPDFWKPQRYFLSRLHPSSTVAAKMGHRKNRLSCRHHFTSVRQVLWTSLVHSKILILCPCLFSGCHLLPGNNAHKKEEDHWRSCKFRFTSSFYTFMIFVILASIPVLLTCSFSHFYPLCTIGLHMM